MPRRIVHIRLWQLLAFSAGLIVMFSLGLVLLTNTIHKEQRNAHRIGATRNEQIHGLRQAARTSCGSRHLLSRSQVAQDIAVRASNDALITFLKRTLAPVRPGMQLTPQQREGLRNLLKLQADLERANAKARQANRLATRADCRGIPHVPLPG